MYKTNNDVGEKLKDNNFRNLGVWIKKCLFKCSRYKE